MARRVIVTGSGGISSALIRALDARGDATFIIGGTDADAHELQKVCKNLNGFATVDLQDESTTTSAFSEAKKVLGKVTDVVGVVGGSGRKFGDARFDSITLDAWEKTLSLNLTTAFLTLRESLRILDSGSITLTSSVLATHPVSGHFDTHAYATSKAAIQGMVRVAASSYVKAGIRVNAVAPGLVDTPMANRAATDPEIQRFIKEKQPLAGAQLPATSLVPAYLYLIDNEFVTGEILTVDGGWRVS